ncbi:MAG: glycolate oxidase subunit GlcF [Proteobacteria bacterium]|nr:glycolate oxidase subunit GlcF [Pseudomonadota bacterium]
MQTHFTPGQLADPAIGEANSILRACVHCGLCTSTCPTYRLLGDELDSPRGRIYLMKEMLEQDRPPSPTDVRHIDRCLSCLSCMTACPAGVHYMHLVDHARSHIEKTHRRPLVERVIRDLLGRILPYPDKVRWVLEAARLARPFAALFPGTLGRLTNLAPASQKNKVVTPPDAKSFYPAEGERKFRVALLAGCVQPGIAPQINAASIRVLTRHGCEVVVPPEAGCCGALTHHLGQEARATSAAAANIRAWMSLLEGEGLDAIIVNASGCGTMIKDYGHLFRFDTELMESAKTIASLARDISEFLSENFGDIGATTDKTSPPLRVAYQSACSLRHGQKIQREPVALLQSCGFEVTEPRDSHLCCGSAGTYNILQPDIADRLRDDKIDALARTGPQVIASGNVGCMVQLASVAPWPVVHTVELLDWATGGPRPEALSGVTT